MIRLTLSFNDLFPHLEHIWVLVHVKTCPKGVLVVAFEKVLERLPLKHSFCLTYVVIFQLRKVKIGLVRGDHWFCYLILRGRIWNIKSRQIQRRHNVFARAWIFWRSVSSLISWSWGYSLRLFINHRYLVCCIDAILDYCALSTVKLLWDFNFRDSIAL
jgi:hypothetical protein